MKKLKKYSLVGKEAGTVEVKEGLLNATANGQLVKDYIVALRANARQWSANTKTRSEVSHSTKKPHPQKGGGRARQGSLAAPQYKGGGRVFGPRPKFDQHVKINKKERLAAIRFLIGDKLRNDRVTVIENTAIDAPKTKAIFDLLEKLKIAGQRILFVGEAQYAEIDFGDFVAKFSDTSEQHNNFIRSMRNIPKTQFALAPNVNGYDLALASHIVVTEKALNDWQDWLVKEVKE